MTGPAAMPRARRARRLGPALRLPLAPTVRGPLALTVGLSLVLTACIPVARPQTILHTVPDPIPRERWVQGRPALAVSFEGAFVSWEGGPLVRDEARSEYFLRLLRKTQLFADVVRAGVDDRLPHHARLEIHDDPDPTFFPRGVQLDSRMRFVIAGPDGEKVYEARSVVEHVHVTVNRAPEARQIVRNECDEHNFLSLVHQMRSDPRLFQPGPGRR